MELVASLGGFLRPSGLTQGTFLMRVCKWIGSTILGLPPATTVQLLNAWSIHNARDPGSLLQQKLWVAMNRKTLDATEAALRHREAREFLGEEPPAGEEPAKCEWQWEDDLYQDINDVDHKLPTLRSKDLQDGTGKRLADAWRSKCLTEGARGRMQEFTEETGPYTRWGFKPVPNATTLRTTLGQLKLDVMDTAVCFRGAVVRDQTMRY